MSADAAADRPVVTTATGRVRGIRRPDGTAAFLGIPYAQPPVGDLRFAAPAPAASWADVREAAAYGPTPQRGDHPNTLIPEPSIPGDDTLSVNVFAPAGAEATDAAPRPVLVYIHGGGFVQGSPASPWYDGGAFANVGIVVVTVSYRLGFDGFGLIPGADTNRGVRDWIAALEWVQRNVAAFGGDPGDVTIAGQSAGGGAVLTLLGMPRAQHLFHRVLSISAALTNVPPSSAAELTTRLAARAGVAPTRDGFASVDELRLLELQNHLLSAQRRGALKAARRRIAEGSPWGPIVDGDLIPRPTLEAIADDVGADKPLVLGTTDDEFAFLLESLEPRLRAVPAGLALGLLGVHAATRWSYIRANRAKRREGTAAFLGRYVTDRVFRDTVPRIADARGQSRTWTYRFTWPSPTRGAAIHCLDLPFWWNRLDAPGVVEIAGDAPPPELAEAMHASAVSFVTGGDPGWTSWSTSPGTTRIFGPTASDTTASGATTSGAPVDPDGYASVRALLPRVRGRV